MHYLHPLLPEDTIQVKILGVQCAPHLPGTVVMHPRAAGAISHVGNIELVTVSPGAALCNLLSLIGHMPA